MPPRCQAASVESIRGMPLDTKKDRPESGMAAAVPATGVLGNPKPDTGFIDMYGFAGSLSGWFFCGWVGRRDSAAGAEAADFIARFEEGEVAGKATVSHFQR